MWSNTFDTGIVKASEFDCVHGTLTPTLKAEAPRAQVSLGKKLFGKYLNGVFLPFVFGKLLCLPGLLLFSEELRTV
jgi:hypothetical protein